MIGLDEPGHLHVTHTLQVQVDDGLGARVHAHRGRVQRQHRRDVGPHDARLGLVEGHEDHVGIHAGEFFADERRIVGPAGEREASHDLPRVARPFALERFLHALGERRARREDHGRVQSVGHRHERDLARLVLERERSHVEVGGHFRGRGLRLVQREHRLARAVALRERRRAVARDCRPR